MNKTANTIPIHSNTTKYRSTNIATSIETKAMDAKKIEAILYLLGLFIFPILSHQSSRWNFSIIAQPPNEIIPSRAKERHSSFNFNTAKMMATKIEMRDIPAHSHLTSLNVSLKFMSILPNKGFDFLIGHSF